MCYCRDREKGEETGEEYRKRAHVAEVGQLDGQLDRADVGHRRPERLSHTGDLGADVDALREPQRERPIARERIAIGR